MAHETAKEAKNQSLRSSVTSATACGNAECEAKIKEESKATMRCIPLEQPWWPGKCIYCGRAAKEKGIFDRAY